MYLTLTDKLTDDEFIITAIETNQKNSNDVQKNSLLMVNDIENHDDESGLSASEYEKLHAAAPAGVGPLYKNGSAVHNTTLPKGEPDEALNVTERNTTTKGTYHMPEDMAASKCASEGGMCSCLGQVHFGLKSSSF